MQWGEVRTELHLSSVVEFLGSENKFTWIQVLFLTLFFYGGILTSLYLGEIM